MLNEIDNILQEIDKFKGSVQSSEEFARQLHKDLAVIEAYTDTVKAYEQQLLSALEKNTQSGQKHIEAVGQTILLELASNRQAELKEREAATRSLLSAIEKTAKEIQEKNEALTTRIESLIKRKLQWLLLISALNSVGILLLLFLR